MSVCLLAACDWYTACGFPSLSVSVYPCVYLSADSYCWEASRFSANQQIAVSFGTWTVFTMYNGEK